MDTGKEIIHFTNNIVENVTKLDEIIDKAIDPIKDYSDTIGDIATPIKALISFNNLRKKLALKAFIKNYASELSKNYEIDKDETIKLEEFFKDNTNILCIRYY